MIKAGILRWILLIAFYLAVAACEQSSRDRNDTLESDPDTGIDLNAPLVRARVPTGAIKPGDAFEIEIGIDNFPSTEGGGITLRFNPAVIRVDRVDIEPAWNFVTSPGQIDNIAGEVRDILFSSFDHPGGNAAVARLYVTAVSAGRSSIVVAESSLNPFAGSGTRLAIQFIGNDIEVK